MDISTADPSQPQLASLEPEVPPRVQAIELAVFLFLILPSMAMSFLAFRQGKLSFGLVSIATILRDLALLSLILFFLWKNRERFTRIGWNFRNAWQEILLGIALFIPMVYGTDLLDKALLKIGVPAPATPTPSYFDVSGTGDVALALLLVTVVAITEESIFRGYLILRLNATTRSTAAAVILSSVIFSIGHGYEGTLGVITVGAMGFVFALIYLWRGSLLAPMVMHFLQDFMSILLLPLLGRS